MRCYRLQDPVDNPLWEYHSRYKSVMTIDLCVITSLLQYTIHYHLIQLPQLVSVAVYSNYMDKSVPQIDAHSLRSKQKHVSVGFKQFVRVKRAVVPSILMRLGKSLRSMREC